MKHNFGTEVYTNAFAKHVRVNRITGPDARDISDLRKQIDLGVGEGRIVRDALIENHAVLVGANMRPMRRVKVGGMGQGGSFAASVAAPFQPQSPAGIPQGVTCAPGQGSPRSADARCLDEIPCHADILGATTLAAARFPLVGGAAPTTATFTVTPQNATSYKPAFIYFEGRDAANAFAAIPLILTDAQITGYPQLSSSGIEGGVISSAFNVDCPLDARKFDTFGSQNNNGLNLTVANILGGAVNMHAFFVFWGDNVT